MISPLIAFYIAIRYRKASSKQLKELSAYYNSLPQVGNNKIVFSFLTIWPTILGANATIKGIIIFSAEWAAQLILFNNEETSNAFIITLGHELAHQDGDFPLSSYNHKEKHFIHWITEVHHDFSAAERMTQCSRKKLLASILYKINAKPNNEDEHTHPSWKTRKEYVLNYNFDIRLINQIAMDTGCTNTILVEKVCSHYKPIYLI